MPPTDQVSLQTVRPNYPDTELAKLFKVCTPAEEGKRTVRTVLTMARCYMGQKPRAGDTPLDRPARRGGLYDAVA
ncbi:MAG TPA: hypothetical protein VN939_04420, partial [Chthoniobacterales bacterium]|nr:hypothetical protein [Chthoniobacterales bacterium]